MQKPGDGWFDQRLIEFAAVIAVVVLIASGVRYIQRARASDPCLVHRAEPDRSLVVFRALNASLSGCNIVLRQTNSGREIFHAG